MTERSIVIGKQRVRVSIITEKRCAACKRWTNVDALRPDGECGCRAPVLVARVRRA